MAGIGTRTKIKIFDPLSEAFNASQFEFLCALDQETDTATDKDPETVLWTHTGIIDHGLHKYQKSFMAPMYRVTWPVVQPSWIHATALLYQCPGLVREYMVCQIFQDTDMFKRIFDNQDLVEPHLVAIKATTANPRKFNFGIEVPANPAHALYLDRLYGWTGEDSWAYAIEKELDQLKAYSTFRVVKDDRPVDMAYQKLPYKIIFYV
jgi:hypothetical protein